MQMLKAAIEAILTTRGMFLSLIQPSPNSPLRLLLGAGGAITRGMIADSGPLSIDEKHTGWIRPRSGGAVRNGDDTLFRLMTGPSTAAAVDGDDCCGVIGWRVVRNDLETQSMVIPEKNKWKQKERKILPERHRADAC